MNSDDLLGEACRARSWNGWYRTSPPPGRRRTQGRSWSPARSSCIPAGVEPMGRQLVGGRRDRRAALGERARGARHRASAVQYLARPSMSEQRRGRPGRTIAITCARSTRSRRAGGYRARCVGQGAILTRGIMHQLRRPTACRSSWPGSLRDDGPLPEVITDMNAAQEAYSQILQDAGDRPDSLDDAPRDRCGEHDPLRRF